MSAGTGRGHRPVASALWEHMEKEQRKPALHAVGCSRAVTCEPHRGPALNLNRFRGLTRKWVSFKSPQVGLLQISRRFSRAVYLSLCLDSRRCAERQGFHSAIEGGTSGEQALL